MRSQIAKFSKSFRFSSTAAVVTMSALLLAGCGGSMAGSATAWSFGGVTAYGDPDVKVTPTAGTTEGAFVLNSFSPVTATGSPIFLESIVSAEVPNVNAAQYTSASPQQVGAFSIEWSEVFTSGQTAPRAQFNSTAGTTFTGATTVAPNVLLTATSGNFVTVSTPGPLTIKLHVSLQTADGSTKSQDFYATLYITAASTAATAAQ